MWQAAPPFDRIGDLLVSVDMVDRLGTVERQAERSLRVPGDVLGIGVSLQLQPGVDRRRGRQPVRIDVVAPPAEVVVGVPGDVGCQHCDLAARAARGHDPGERKEPPAVRARVKIIKSRPLGGRDVLCMLRVGVAVLVPLDAGLGVVAIGRDLHGRPRPVLVEPADLAATSFPAVAPQVELVRLDRMDAELGLSHRPHPLGPGVAEQAVGQQAELERRPGGER